MTKPRKHNTGKDHFKYQLSLNDAKIIDVADTDEIRFACEIRPKGCEDKKNAYIIVFPNVEDKYVWVKEIKSLVKEFQRKQLAEEKRNGKYLKYKGGNIHRIDIKFIIRNSCKRYSNNRIY